MSPGHDSRPVLFVTNHAPAYRHGAFAALHERENVLYALSGGRLQHGAPGVADLPAPHRDVSQREVFALAASGAYRAVVCGMGGRVALPAAWTGARRARVPFLLWASLWAQPRTPAQVVGYPALARIYRGADAVVTYGSHVSAYVRARGARNVHIAPQAVDNDFWATPGDAPEVFRDGRGRPLFTVLFVGRPVRGKGIRVLTRAWRALGSRVPAAALVLVGVRPEDPRVRVGGAAASNKVIAVGSRPAADVRNFYTGADVVVVPSVSTASFREPWGLVVNEAMNQNKPVIASDAVGAAAGGLVRHERNGLIVPAADADALAAALVRLYDDPQLRARLGAAGARDVARFTHAAWADGFTAALASVSASQARACAG